MCFTDDKKRHLKLTDSVLLAPAWDSSITKKAHMEIKNALFQFLKTVNRKVWASFSSTLTTVWYTGVVLLWFYSLCSKIYLQFAIFWQYLSSTGDNINYWVYVLIALYGQYAYMEWQYGFIKGRSTSLHSCYTYWIHGQITWNMEAK